MPQEPALTTPNEPETSLTEELAKLAPVEPPQNPTVEETPPAVEVSHELVDQPSKKRGKSKKEPPKPKEMAEEPPKPEYTFKHDMLTPETVLMVETQEILEELDSMVLEARKLSRKYKISGDPEDGINLAAARDKYRDRWEKLSGKRIPMRVYWSLFTTA